jgi:chromosome segregation ATPase
MESIKRYFGFLEASQHSGQVAPQIDFKDTAVAAQSVPDMNKVEFQSLISFISEQISEVGAQQEKCFNDWMRSTALLAERTRMMTVGAAELIAEAARRDADLRDASSALRLAEASVIKYEAELSELRPARAQLEDERRRLASGLEEAVTSNRSLKETLANLKEAMQEQADKAIAAEIQLRRCLEDRASLVSAVAEAERARHAKTVENGQLKSEQLAGVANIQRLEQDLDRIGAKLSSEIAAHESSRSSVRTLTEELQRMKQQNDDLTERLAVTERAMALEANAQSSEISQQALKIVGLKSNASFLERQRDKYREDFQMALERIGVLELSNADLLKKVSSRQSESDQNILVFPPILYDAGGAPVRGVASHQ